MEPFDLHTLETEHEPNVETIEAWTTPMFVVELPEHDVLKEDLMTYAYQTRKTADTAIASDVAVSAKNNLFESRLNFLETDAQGVSELALILEELVSAVAEQVNAAFLDDAQGLGASIVESWCHITEKGGYHDVHSHPNCSWCGIYYLDAGDSELNNRSGVNRFYDPRHCANQYHDAGTYYLDATGVWDVVPKSGQIVIFPSYLKHSALPYFGDTDRVVIAFNCVVNPI